jgi:glutathione S-transferase
MKPSYAAKNPNKLVPLLEDGDFRLTESSSILKYLAEKSNSPAYPKDLKARAKVNEMMDWVNTQLCRDLAYGLVYPQIFPGHKRPTDEFQKGQLAWAKERAQGWMKVLDQSLIGKQQYLCGDQITIADYFGIALLTLGEVVRVDFSRYPNVQRWLNNMKKLPNWNKVNEAFYGLRDALKDKPFKAI